MNEWKDTLEAFRKQVDRKYGATLCAGGSGSWIKDASKKISWTTEKEDILELRRKLQTGSDAITMLVLAAMQYVCCCCISGDILMMFRKSNRLDSATQERRVKGVHSLLQEAMKNGEEQTKLLKVVNGKIDEQAQKSNMILTTVKSNFTYL